uniref:Alpha-mannosidase n=1 Tax=Clastoptera arizonana TaxID=38151 RepID=A0A1B6DE70_9HEMI
MVFKLYIVISTCLLCLSLNHANYTAKHSCGYSACNKLKRGFRNVHMIPHTHDDVGWLKTVDQYFYGSNSSIQLAGVQYIIDSVIMSLLKDPKKRFVYVETAFFWKWWSRQNSYIQKQVKKLVNEGRLEFIGGGWSMHDEAASHYHSIIDQMTWGFRKLDDIFGQCGRPRIGWQIDPFGHSRESASMMARFGFDGLLFSRLDYQEKKQRLFNKTAEMLWETSDNLGEETDLFTSILYNHYSAPKNFCFSIFCNDDPIIDDRTSTEFNAEDKATAFITMINEMFKNYSSPTNVAVTMGDDFNYQAAEKYFINIDRLIKAVNALQQNGSDINLFYSTPSCYVKALNDENLIWPTKNDDFFPYGSDEHSYWTGYFTSRPALKFYERMGNNFLQICKQLYTLANIKDNEEHKLNIMREAMGVLQHHDAITGTERQHVASDYARQLDIGFSNCASVSETVLRKLISKSELKENFPSEITLQSCMLLNISSCNITETFDSFVVTLYNPLSRIVSKNVRLPVPNNGSYYEVYDSSGTQQTIQVVPIHKLVLKIPGRSSLATEEVVFVANDLPALGYKSYYVTKTKRLSHSRSRLHVSKTKALSLKNRTIHQSFWWYKSFPGINTDPNHRASGAYVFRPDRDPKKINKSPKSKKYTGSIVDEVHQVFNDWVSQVIRNYKGSDVIEYNWLIGPIPIDDNNGKEIITRYTIRSIKSKQDFYTDSNGREILRRTRNSRPSYILDLKEPVSGNYYPVTTRIMIKDDKAQFSVITDRSHGGSSIADGQVELMLHRRILRDDGFGVAEALNEKAFGDGLVVRGLHYVTLGDPANQSAIDRLLIQEKILSAWTFFTPTTATFEEWKTSYNMENSGLKRALPENIQITTLEPWKNNKYLIRLEHIMELNDDTKWSKPVTVNLMDIFSPFKIISVKEVTLGGNLLLKNMKRLKWMKGSSKKQRTKTIDDKVQKDNRNIKLSPMEIRSFIVEVKFN